MNPVILHINYCEQTWGKLGRTVEDVFKKTNEWGYDGVELRGKPQPDLNMTEDEYIDAICAANKKYPIKHIMFGRGPAGVTDLDPAIRKKAVDDTIEFFKKVNDKLGTTLSNTFGDTHTNPNIPYDEPNYGKHGSAYASYEQWNYTVEGFQRLGAALEKIGVRIAFETHMNYIHDIPSSAKKLVDLIGSKAVGINMDYGNTVYFKGIPSVEDTIKLYGDKLFYTHLKNSIGTNGGRNATALGEGEINHRNYLKALKAIGFSGPIGIEAPRPGDREYYAVSDIAYFKSVAKDINL